MKGSPLSGTLSFLLPDPAEAALLAVCTSPGRAREAWAEWRRLGGDLDRYRSLLPQVAAGAREGSLELDEPLAALLSAARLHESLRWNAIRQIAGEVIDRLGGLGLDFLVMQGLALAETVYPDPALRHCGSLELLLPAGAVAEAGAVLDAVSARGDGFPLRLSASPLPRVKPGAGASAILNRSRDAQITGRMVRVPAPEDALALVLGGAAVGAERRTLLWVCDATRQIEAAPGIDWDVVAGVTAAWDLGIPIGAMLGWLASDLDVPIPRAAVKRVARASSGSRAQAIETALECVRADGRAGPGSLLARSRGWREMASVLRWTAFPSADRMRRSYPGIPTAFFPLLYAARPGLYAARKSLGFLTRHRRPNADGGPLVRAVGSAAARSGGPSAAVADPASANPRSWE
jgi:hypothetical protein